MVKVKTILVAALTIIALQVSCGARAQSPSAAETSKEARVEGVASATVLTLRGKIIGVNEAKKLVTVQGPQGRKIVLRVENPYNLHSAKVGEPVVAHFYEVVMIRKKQLGETIPSASVSEGISTAKPGEIPGAAAGARVSIVVSVVAIDRQKGTVTVKGPDGSVETVKARYPDKLKQLKVGDELVVSVARAVAISLEKQPTG